MTKDISYIDAAGEVIELDDDWLAKAKPVSNFPELTEILRKHGRPALPETARKQRVTHYLGPVVLARLKADGKGWQTRENAQLRKGLGL